MNRRRPRWGILSRYLFAQLAPPTLLAVGGFTLLLFLPLFFEALAWAQLGGIAAGPVLQFLFCFIPRLTIITLPMALLLASLFVFGRMTEEREIDAMLTSGVPYARILEPALALAVACGLLLLAWCHVVSPRAVELQRHLADRMIDRLQYPVLEGGQFNALDKNALFVRRVDPGTGTLRDVVFFGLTLGGPWGSEQRVDYFVTAPYGQAVLRGASRELELTLSDGTFHRPAGERDYTQGRFDTWTFHLNVEKQLGRALSSAMSREEGMPTGMLRVQAERNFARAGENPNFSVRGRRYLIEWHRRFSHPAGCVVLVLLGVPLGILTGLGRKAASFALAVAIILAYYVAAEACGNLAESGALPVAVGVWLTPVGFLCCGLGLNAHLARR